MAKDLAFPGANILLQAQESARDISDIFRVNIIHYVLIYMVGNYVF